MKWFWLLGLTLAAWEDLRSREFPYWIFWIWLVPGIGNAASDGLLGHLEAASVGAGLLLVSRATRGALGAGDGLFFLLSACYLDLRETGLLLIMGLGISGIWSMAVILRNCMAQNRDRHSDRRGGTIPFLACIWLPGLWLVWR